MAEVAQIDVFRGLVTDENSVTQLLANMLRHEPFRAVVLPLLIPADLTGSMTANHIITQLNLGDEGRPDLAVINDRVALMIEVKVWDTGLTCNQPASYLNYLSTASGMAGRACTLALLTPKAYAHQLTWDERLAACRHACARIHVVHLTWEQVIESIERSGLASHCPWTQGFLALLKNWFCPPAPILTEEQMLMLDNREMGLFLRSLYATVDAAAEAVEQLGLRTKRSKYRSAVGLDYSLEVISPRTGREVFYFGTWSRLWVEHGHALCYGVSPGRYEHAVVERFRQLRPQRIAHKGYYLWEMAPVSSTDVAPGGDLGPIARQLVPQLAKELEAVSRAS